jgi:sugar (pentulose or hexulose) kinase
MSEPVFVGLDIGTSGVRACAIDADAAVVATSAAPMPAPRRDGPCAEQDPAVWWEAAVGVLRALVAGLAGRPVARLAVDGTSGTLLLVDGTGHPVSTGLLYNDARSVAEAAAVAEVAPPESGAHGPTAALAKLLHLAAAGLPDGARHAVHQADWIAGRLAGRHGVSDENNALKLGYDPLRREWPAWLDRLGLPRALLPEVRVPGTALAPVDPVLARELGLSPETGIQVGTTDGVAAFLATRAAAVGDAVTSLGTTLVLKILADRPVSDPAVGVYSHRLGDRWLAGGASNSGGAALLAHFDAARIEALTPQLQPERPTGLDYYPLPGPGERFPVRDPALAPRVTPRPAEDAVFLQGLLEGIAAVEALAYGRLAELGAPAPRRVLTVGGGARNAAWTKIRAARLGVPVLVADQTEAAYGTALLARAGGPP